MYTLKDQLERSFAVHQHQPLPRTSSAPQQRGQFSPYWDNGGTAVAIAGEDFVVLGADTRLSDGGYGIQSRQVTKCVKLTDKCVLASAGMQTDRVTLHKLLNARMQEYELHHRQSMSTTAIAQMLSNTLYHRRFMPYYTFNILAGLDSEGKGAVYGYDAIGSYERSRVICSGTGQSLIQPVLDNQVDGKNRVGVEGNPPLRSLDETVQLVKDTFTSAGERDIYTGDYVDIFVISKDGVSQELFELKKD